MLLELPIMLLSIIPKTSLLCLNYAQEFSVMHSVLHLLLSDIHLHYDSYNIFLLNSSLLIIAFITYQKISVVTFKTHAFVACLAQKVYLLCWHYARCFYHPIMLQIMQA